MGKSRPRFNEKARASSLRPTQRPHPKARDGGLGVAAFDPELAPAAQQQPKKQDLK
ncbi:hypothetical protein BCV72DRAFT_197243 [Rhizopus microsporus var. microsporus]|jgi:ATP-dependent RNA helicase DHX37/DHR1|uniref:Uncharacterized protein n=1 Tax=Rhizopus microsporus var. microsporus TaxID=86635 RepID=A0A1X0RI33_RHIZD|nr:hypothetical protein BCV72DRAFT_197243 [Rhizopus microsporus var. microsporus]